MKKDSNEEIILINSGNQSMFASVKEGETILLGDPSTSVYFGSSNKKENKILTLVNKKKKKK